MEKKKSDQFSPHLFLVGIVAIVAIVALVLYGNGMTGAPVNKIQVEDWVEVCTDDDSKNDPYVAGIVAYGRIEYVDSCNDGMLQQFYCGSKKTIRNVPSRECPNGCENGACLK